MRLDILDLTGFYATPLGALARRLIAARIRTLWPRSKGETVVALGFGTPYLETYRRDARRIAALMPASQGGLVWPTLGEVNTVLVDEERLPLADNSVDKVLAIHCLELSEQAQPLLRELWRVLAPEGELLLVVPNRMGVWSRREATPFGHGQPFSRGQLERLLTDNFLTPIEWSSALHALPVRKSFALKWAPVVERIGATLWPRFAGLTIVVARKEVTAAIPTGHAVRASPRVATVRGLVSAPGARRDEKTPLGRQSEEGA